MTTRPPSVDRPRLRDVVLLFFRIGNSTFGGGDPTIAALQREFDRRNWIDPDRFSIAYGLARITPGTNMLAFCAAAGWFLRGMLGAIGGVLAVTLPSAVLVVWITHVYGFGERNALARTIISAVVAASVGTMVAAAGRLVGSQISKTHWIRPALITASAFALARVFALSPLQIIGIAALVGFFWLPRKPEVTGK
jgi:chromate transporter